MEPLVRCPECYNSTISYYHAGQFWCHGCNAWQNDPETTEECQKRLAEGCCKKYRHLMWDGYFKCPDCGTEHRNED